MDLTACSMVNVASTWLRVSRRQELQAECRKRRQTPRAGGQRAACGPPDLRTFRQEGQRWRPRGILESRRWPSRADQSSLEGRGKSRRKPHKRERKKKVMARASTDPRAELGVKSQCRSSMDAGLICLRPLHFVLTSEGLNICARGRLVEGLEQGEESGCYTIHRTHV